MSSAIILLSVVSAALGKISFLPSAQWNALDKSPVSGSATTKTANKFLQTH